MKTCICLALSFLIAAPAFAQADTSAALYKTLRAADSLLFNIGFNQCDIRQFEALVSDSFEFYHDEAGVTASKAAFISGIKDGLCTLPYKPKRVLAEHSLMAYPLEKDGVLYGAIQTGTHRFYAIEQNKPERLTSSARFMHLWLLQGGRWKLSRAFSYDHH